MEAHAQLLRRTCAWGLGLGLPLAYLAARPGAATSPLPVWMELLDSGVASMAMPALALGYAAGLALLFRRDIFRGPLMLLAPVGRTALSNYLLQSVAAVFYGIGFGLFGTLSLVVLLGGVTAFFVVQIAISRVWLTVATFGPAEWLWRQFAYGRGFSLR